MSSDPHEASIRVQVLGGVWETIGSDRYRGVAAEGLQMSSNAWGADTCSFTLRRDPAAVHPDLLAWTPVEVWIGGVLTWDGRVKETPAQEGADFSLNVQCEGWQYHLDDDVYTKTYVHTRLSDFGDVRSVPTANLALLVQYGQVQMDAGSILLSVPKSTVLVAATGVAVVVDLGPGGQCERAVVATTTSANTTSLAVYVIGTDTPYWGDSVGAARDDMVSAVTINAANGVTSAGTAATPHRYVTLLLYNASATVTTGADIWVRFSSVQLFADTAYESAGNSILTSDLVVKDALTQATVLLSADTSNVKAGTLFGQDPNGVPIGIPEFTMSDYQTPREVISAVNAYENFETKMLPGRRVAFRPRASAPVYEIGEWSGADFADASTNSGDDIFNKVVVQGTGPDGANLTTIRYAAAQPGAGPMLLTSDMAATNPGFEVNTTGWTATASTITRDTVVFDTGVASGRWDSANTITATLATTLSGTFHPGNVYTVLMRIRPGSAGNFGFAASLLLPHVLIASNSGGMTGNAWHDVSLTVIPTTSFTNPVLTFSAFVPSHLAAATYYVDSITFSKASPTLADRWGFSHSTILPVGTSMTTPSAQRIGDLYLAAHKTTPFRGAFNATPGGVRRVVGGASPHPAWLLADTGQLVRVNKTDPDTGAWSRSGTIAAVAYDHESLTAGISLDSNRAGFDVLLSRLSVVTGQRQT